ncbi:MAG: hypothetical protein F4Y26_06525 [Gammaproteobacteria bacterium]|nr:hypothetical protein [Gammaproteobacteria bacterium]
MSFDLLVLQRARAIGFRFEPGSTSSAVHDYDHVQLSESLGDREVGLSQLLSPMPTQFPAFPLPSHDNVTRFLALVVAMHGYPDGIDRILGAAFSGRPNEHRAYFDITRAMLTTVD